MSKPEILLMRQIYPPTMAVLDREFTVHRMWTAQDPQSFIRDTCADVRGVVTTGPYGFTRTQIEALPKLEIIACFGRGLGTIDVAAAKEHGVVVTNTPDSIAPVVADLAVGLLIAVMRRMLEADRYVRAGKWEAEPFAMGRGLGGKTCGIVGLGDIGREIAKRVEAFGMSVCYHGPHEKRDVAYRYFSELESLARAADCLMVTCPFRPETAGLIDARILTALGAEGFLVNVARGPIVDEVALIAALTEKRIAGAGLDVFWDEPRVPTVLREMDNVVLVPHIGSSTLEVREERSRNVLASLRAHFAGKPVPNLFAAVRK
jgi:lactate dehydrogenase-like 2-hydroxyacid dehydrogenase